MENELSERLVATTSSTCLYVRLISKNMLFIYTTKHCTPTNFNFISHLFLSMIQIPISNLSKTVNLKNQRSSDSRIILIKLKFPTVRTIVAAVSCSSPKMASRRKKKQKRKGRKREKKEREREERRRGGKNRVPLPTVSTVVHTYLRQLVRCQDC